MVPSTEINFPLAKGLIRYRVRKRLATFKGQNIWRTTFFVDRVDLSAEVFDYQQVRKDNQELVNVDELLQIVGDEFRDFILLEDVQKNVELEEPARKITCEYCQVEFTIADTTYCPKCHRPYLYQVARNDLADITTLLRDQFQDPIIRQVLADTERWRIENSYSNVVTIFEKFLKNLNDEAYRVSGRLPQKLKRINLFQNIDDAQRWFLDNHQTDVFSTLTLQEVNILRTITNKRHVITHNGGLIDETYIRKTDGDVSSLYTIIPVSENEILRAIRVIQKVIKTAREVFLPA